jgi:hypothetical protein
MEFQERTPSREAEIIHPTHGSPEKLKLKRLFVDADRTEYVDVDPIIGAKAEELLESQEDVVSNDDIAALLETSHEIAGANCHKTALYLTGKYSKEQLFSPDNDNPVTAGHEYIEENSNLFSDFESFAAALQAKKEFPIRISFFKDKDGKPFAFHSITILGKSNKGTLVAFEKGGPYADTPFRYRDATKAILRHQELKYTPALEK